MPQMMPMFWLFMFLNMMFTLLITMISLYFYNFFLPKINLNATTFSLWSWKWY